MPRSVGWAASRTTSSLGAILALTFIASIGTGILWSGLSFIAKHTYGFSEERTFALYIVTAIAYVGGAFAAGPITRMLGPRRLDLPRRTTEVHGGERRKEIEEGGGDGDEPIARDALHSPQTSLRGSPWPSVVNRSVVNLSPRGILVGIFLAQAIVAATPLFFRGQWVLWFVACATSVLAALLWPIVESYLTAGRHGQAMRSAMGWWNVTWTGAVAVALIAMAPLIGAGHPQSALWAIVALCPLSLVALIFLRGFTQFPGAHDEQMWKQSITPEYPFLLRSARVLLPLSYLLIGVISPLMPYVLEELQVRLIAETPMTATWMVARVLAIALMWRARFWHGRWGALLLGGIGLAVGFAMIVISPNVMTLIAGLALFGAAQGIVYYAALYYAMSVGGAAVDAGGTHEGLIGLGYAAGPVAAMAGLRVAGVMPAVTGAAGITVVVTAVLVVAAVPAAAPYRRALRRRAANAPDSAET